MLWKDDLVDLIILGRLQGCRQGLAPVLQQGALCQGSNPSTLSVPLSPSPTFLPPHPGPGLSVYIQSVMEAERENADFVALQLGSDSLLRSPYERPQSQASMFSENTKPEGDT